MHVVERPSLRSSTIQRLQRKAGSNTAADHIAVLTDAIAQVPAAHRKHLLVRSDGAGASHDLLA